jgi:hypothetical protein
MLVLSLALPHCHRDKVMEHRALNRQEKPGPCVLSLSFNYFLSKGRPWNWLPPATSVTNEPV